MAQRNFGNGLFCDTKKSGEYWVYAYNGETVGDRRDARIGLGPRKTIPLQTAMHEVLLLNEVLKSGVNPRDYRKKLKQDDGPLYFGQAAQQFFNYCADNRWKSQANVMDGVLNNYILKAACAKRPLQTITHLDIEAILAQRVDPDFDARGKRRRGAYELVAELDKKQPGLSNPAAAKILGIDRSTVRRARNYGAPRRNAREVGPLWKAKPDIAKKTQSFLFGMFEYYRARQKFKGENPADVSVKRHAPLQTLLGNRPKGGNHQDLRVDEMPPLVTFLHRPQRGEDILTGDDITCGWGLSEIAIKNARTRGKLVSGHKPPDRQYPNAPYLYLRSEVEEKYGPQKNPIVLRDDDYLNRRMLEMAILTLARESMVTELQWDEIKPNWQGSVQGMIIWQKHKTARFGYPYGTVITPHIQRILDDMRERLQRLDLVGNKYVFPHGPAPHGENHWTGEHPRGAVINERLRQYLNQIECIETKSATAHGLRTTFETWATNLHSYDRDMAMATIGHHLKAPNADIIYLRNWAKLRERYLMMSNWGIFCCSLCPQLKLSQRELLPLRRAHQELEQLKHSQQEFLHQKPLTKGLRSR
jgi:hypothetical protein